MNTPHTETLSCFARVIATVESELSLVQGSLDGTVIIAYEIGQHVSPEEQCAADLKAKEELETTLRVLGAMKDAIMDEDLEDLVDHVEE